jgi:hypothetical protein
MAGSLALAAGNAGEGPIAMGHETATQRAARYFWGNAA